MELTQLERERVDEFLERHGIVTLSYRIEEGNVTKVTLMDNNTGEYKVITDKENRK